MFDKMRDIDNTGGKNLLQNNYSEAEQYERSVSRNAKYLNIGTSVISKTELLEMDVETCERGQVQNGDAQSGVELTYESDRSQDTISGCTRFVDCLERKFDGWTERYGRTVAVAWRCILLLGYLAYFIYSLNYRFGDEGSITLIVITVILFLVIAYRLCGARSRKSSWLPKVMCQCQSSGWKVFVRYGLYVIAVIGLITYLGIEVLPGNPQNAQSLLGIAGIIFICFVMSSKSSKVNWHPVFWGFVIQFVFATLTLRTVAGYETFKWLGDAVQRLLSYQDKGSVFVLGPKYKAMGLAFLSAGPMIFFGALMGVMTHWGVIDFIVVKGGHALSVAMDTGPVESVIAVANIFIGLTQSPLLVRPYIPSLSQSELAALMTCGFASVSGDVMILFIAFGAPANHLLTAAIISAPAALAISKLLVPETEVVDLAAQTCISMGDVRSQNALSAAADGAKVAVKLVVSAMANMLAFVSLLALIDSILVWFGERAGVQGLTFDAICGYVLYPLAYAMGAAPEDCVRVGSLIGIKLFATPMVGYAELGKIIKNRHILEEYMSNVNNTWHWKGFDVILDATNTTLTYGVMSERSEVIITYAMCGFSAFTAIGISLGSLIALCPTRKTDIIKLVMVAFFGGNVASFATGAVAGLLHRNH